MALRLPGLALTAALVGRSRCKFYCSFAAVQISPPRFYERTDLQIYRNTVPEHSVSARTQAARGLQLGAHLGAEGYLLDVPANGSVHSLPFTDPSLSFP